MKKKILRYTLSEAVQGNKKNDRMVIKICHSELAQMSSHKLIPAIAEKEKNIDRE